MKIIIAVLFALIVAPLAFACSYGAAGMSYGFNTGYASYNNFAVTAPVQAYLNIVPLTTYTYQAPVNYGAAIQQYQAPVTIQNYAYSSPLLSITYGTPLPNVIQYQLPLSAPVQPYFSNYGTTATGTCPNCGSALYR